MEKKKMTVISLMQIALLSWVLVVGAEDETHLLIQESQEIKKNPIEISSSKKEFTTLEEMMEKMNEKLENNVRRRKDALVTNKIQISVIMGAWAIFSILWVICNVKIYLGRKRNIHKLEKHYQETSSQMVENKRQELEKKIAMGKERRRRKKRVRKLRQSKEGVERDFTLNTEAETSTSMEGTENVNGQTNYNTSYDQGDTTQIVKDHEERQMVPKESLKIVHPTRKTEMLEEMKKLNKSSIMTQPRNKKTVYDDLVVEKDDKKIISKSRKERQSVKKESQGKALRSESKKRVTMLVERGMEKQD